MQRVHAHIYVGGANPAPPAPPPAGQQATPVSQPQGGGIYVASERRWLFGPIEGVWWFRYAWWVIPLGLALLLSGWLRPTTPAPAPIPTKSAQTEIVPIIERGFRDGFSNLTEVIKEGLKRLEPQPVPALATISRLKSTNSFPQQAKPIFPPTIKVETPGIERSIDKLTDAVQSVSVPALPPSSPEPQPSGYDPDSADERARQGEEWSRQP